MAVSAVRTGLTSLRRGMAGSTSLLAPKTVVRPLMAGIMSKAMRPKNYSRPPPFPYKDTPYGFFQALIDSTTHRIDENSKIIVVDGPMAVGKTKFAKEIAEELDMLYVPDASMDMIYINHYGYDLRQLDRELPPSMRSFDEKDFLRDPKHPNVPGFQMSMFHIRLAQYIDALAHLLSTGQGVVMDRSVYSDFVFVEAMTKFGYLSKQVNDYYYECRQMTVPELMRPHLVVYLDCPVDAVMRKIAARALPHEANSPVLTRQFLAHMENVYKQQHLKELSTHAELLIYDWSEEGESEIVVEDIERIDFTIDKHSPKMTDWKLNDEDAWGEKRMLYTKGAEWIKHWADVPRYEVSELVVSAEDYAVWERVMEEAPGNKYSPGFNADMGDQFLLTKLKPEVKSSTASA